MSESPDKLEALFDAVVQMAPAERAAYLARACGDDEQLRHRVERLLSNLERAGNFLSQDDESPPRGTPGSAPMVEKPGDRIDRYKLLEQIGEGGCGMVYMAEQEEPLRRQVALKIIKLGMDTRSVIARFEAERQALALMDHANIAKVHDAGATESGRPYFVMELVRGIKITEYCDQKHLSTQERLDLFIKVCEAIQHAHQKGIIHRDIKPSNILVTVNDGAAVPKVIDFGIAKATNEQRLTDKTVFTAFEQFIGTPAYVSPEQAGLSGSDIDTRSDIYSLGVLLYELLTGKTPFDPRELLQVGLDEMRRTICENEPPTPSARLKQESKGANDSSQSNIKNQKSKIDNDLDWIVMKCLEKDRARRYETANALARDVERHLNNEPVVASPPSRLYRLRKLIRRNRIAATATAAVAAVMVLGVIISSWQAWRATRAERRSLREAAKSGQVATLLSEMLRGVGPSKALGRDTTMLREILGQTVERIGKELTNQPEVQIELRTTLGTTYHELGRYKEMKDLAEADLALARSRLGAEPLVVAAALDQLGSALCELGNYHDAEARQREALALRRKLLGSEHRLVADSLEGLAHAISTESSFAKVERYPEAEVLSREALAMRRKLQGKEHPQVATSLNNLAFVLQSQGKLDEAEKVQREGLALQEKLFGEEHPDVADSGQNLASLLFARGKLDEAEVMHRKVLTLRRKLQGNHHPAVASSLHALALVLQRNGKTGEAEDLEREALVIQRIVLGDQHPDLIGVLDNLAHVLMDQGKLPEAEALEREAIAIHRKTPGKIDEPLANLALILRQENKLEEAEALLRESLARQRERLSGGKWQNTLAQLADVLLAEGKFAQAEPVASECLAIREKISPNYWRTFNAKKMLGETLLGQRKYAQAETALLSAYEGLKQREEKIPLSDWHWIRDAIQDIIRLYEANGRADQIAEWNTELTQFYAKVAARHRNAAGSGEPQNLNDLAWFLATCSDAAVRDGPAAVTYAEKAVVATNRKDPGFLDTLAAARAAAGEFTKAVSVEQEAMALAKNDSLKRGLEARLKLYQSNTPYREP